MFQLISSLAWNIISLIVPCEHIYICSGTNHLSVPFVPFFLLFFLRNKWFVFIFPIYFIPNNLFPCYITPLIVPWNKSFKFPKTNIFKCSFDTFFYFCSFATNDFCLCSQYILFQLMYSLPTLFPQMFPGNIYAFVHREHII